MQSPSNTSVGAIEIVIEPKTFERSISGAVTGPIWLRCEGTNFPEAEWNDFPVIVLGWWLNHLSSLVRGAKNEVFSFMDGPFEFNVANEASNLLRLQLIERHSDGNSVASEFTVALSAVQTTLQSAAATVLAECDRRGWAGRDVDDLRTLAAAGRH